MPSNVVVHSSLRVKILTQSTDTMAGEIEVEVVYTDKDANLIVRDTGVGIPETGS
jgi:signal transduction histidine kinase